MPKVLHEDTDRHIAHLCELGQSLQALDIVLLDLIKHLKQLLVLVRVQRLCTAFGSQFIKSLLCTYRQSLIDFSK